MNPILDTEIYNERMRRSMLDKIWFLDKIDKDIEIVYDYGCADGSLLKLIHEINPSIKLLGYDISDDMIESARRNLLSEARITKVPQTNLHNTVLNASSVFHEIHAYSNDITKEYANIFESGAEYIAIRDMFYTRRSQHPTNMTYLARVYQHEDLGKIAEFESFNGSLTENVNFLHYLLTYRYTENWDREVRENYFPHSIEEFLNKIPTCYKVIHFEHYTLPYIRTIIEKDFGFTINDPTHAKILLKLIHTEEDTRA